MRAVQTRTLASGETRWFVRHRVEGRQTSTVFTDPAEAERFSAYLVSGRDRARGERRTTAARAVSSPVRPRRAPRDLEAAMDAVEDAFRARWHDLDEVLLDD